MAATVLKLAVLLVPGHKPQAHRNLRRVKELSGQGDHTVHQVRLDDMLADFPFAGGVGGHGPVGHDKTSNPRGREVMDEVLDPGVVGVVHRRDAVFPAGVFPKAFAAPVAHVEGRIGEDEIGAQVFVQVVVKTVRMLTAKVSVQSSDGQVHHGQPPGGGVGLLAVDGDVAQAAAVLLNKALALDEHPA